MTADGRWNRRGAACVGNGHAARRLASSGGMPSYVLPVAGLAVMLATVISSQGVTAQLHAAKDRIRMIGSWGNSDRLSMVTDLSTAVLLAKGSLGRQQLLPFLAMAIAVATTAGTCDGIERAAPGTVSPAPYPPSSEIGDITFDWSTHDRRAAGSDNWPITWADDSHQYTSWGDGGGFGGTNSDGRVSLGVARVEGSAASHTGFNVWGGKDAENPATFDGKSYGIISVDGTLYMWRSPGSGPTGYGRVTVYSSTNHGASWTAAGWDFLQSDGLINPTFLQFGQDYAGARDSYVYMYANELTDASDLKVQKPGEIALMRVPKNAIMDRTQYEFFAGLEGSGVPIWVTDLTQRQPVFEDAAGGVGWNTSANYNPGLGRYLIITEHSFTSRGNIGIFDAPEPWGPWTTVLYESGFGAPTIESSTFFWNFANKWLSADGRDFVLVFTGIGSNDSWNSVGGTLEIR